MILIQAKIWDALAYIKQVTGSEAKIHQASTIHQARGQYIHMCYPHMLTVNTGQFRYTLPLLGDEEIKA